MAFSPKHGSLSLADPTLLSLFIYAVSLRIARQLSDLVLDHSFARLVVDGPYQSRKSWKGLSTTIGQPFLSRYRGSYEI